MSSCWLLVLGLVGAAGSAPNIEWQGQFRITYDDNPFEYSSTDLERFRLRASPNRFPLRTSDDLDADIGLGLTCRYRLADRGGTFGLRTRLHQYVSNPEKSYDLATLEVGQGLWRSGRMNASYLYLPSYLIRYFRNPATSDTGDYIGCTFSEHLASVSLRYRLGSAALQPGYRYEYDDYLPAFDYYDTRAHRMGAAADWEPLRTLSLTAGYEYKLAAARGPVPDISYDQHEGRVSVLTRPRKLSRFSIEAGYSFARRRFTTKNPGEVDPGHAGRVDQIESVSVEGRYQLPGAALVAGYEFEWRGVSSPYRASIEDIKNYRAGRLSLGVEVKSGKAR
jgi:hypothetical protein